MSSETRRKDLTLSKEIKYIETGLKKVVDSDVVEHDDDDGFFGQNMNFENIKTTQSWKT